MVFGLKFIHFSSQVWRPQLIDISQHYNLSLQILCLQYFNVLTKMTRTYFNGTNIYIYYLSQTFKGQDIKVLDLKHHKRLHIELM